MIRKTMKVWVVGVVLSLIGLISFEAVSLRDAQAIPAFARKYDFACNVCHVPSFPKLNDFGNLFRDHGYQLGTDQELPTFEGLTKGFWPVSFRTTVGYQYQSTGGLLNATSLVGDVTATSGSFGFSGLDILSFGILNRDISFGVVFTPGLAGAGFNTTPGGSTSDLESAFVRLDNLQRFVGLGENNYLMNLKVGKFELDLPFSVKRVPADIVGHNFLIYSYNSFTPLVGGGFTPALTNPDNFAFVNNHPGIELAGIAPTSMTNGYFRYSLAGISNSDVNQGTTGGGRALQFYGHVTQSFGGYGIVSGQRIGLFGMYGRAPTTPNAAGCPLSPCGTGENSQTFSRMGIDASTTWGGQVNLFGAWMFAKDSQNLFLNNPNLVGNAQEARWNGGFIEADYNPTALPLWLFIYRYDWITNTQQPDSGATQTIIGQPLPGNFNNLQGHTAAIRYNFMFTNRTDIALHLEYHHLTDKHTAASGGNQVQDTMLVGLDFAF